MTYSAFDLTGKVALVTGGNGGIGLGMARALVEAGASICICGSNPEKNTAALAELEDLGADAQALECDVGDREQVEAGFAATLERFGRVDACFANAGVNRWHRSFLDITPEEWRRVPRVNLDGAFHTFQIATRHMIERAEAGDEGGRLVATGSLAAISGAARNEHYAATKGGLVSMVRALAVELARHRMTANVIQPGWIETAMTQEKFHRERFASAVLPRVPMRLWGEPADFGDIAVYLASDASAYHTGTRSLSMRERRHSGVRNAASQLADPAMKRHSLKVEFSVLRVQPSVTSLPLSGDAWAHIRVVSRSAGPRVRRQRSSQSAP